MGEKLKLMIGEKGTIDKIDSVAKEIKEEETAIGKENLAGEMEKVQQEKDKINRVITEINAKVEQDEIEEAPTPEVTA